MIAIIDYGVGNLASVEKAVRFIGYEAEVTSDAKRILNADAVILPGVGAFEDAMKQLAKINMIETVKTAVSEDKPFLGICLGMQLLFEKSDEAGDDVPGLCIFEGTVNQIPSDMGLKVPHMGWNSLKIKGDSVLLKDIGNEPYVYFVHSYGVRARNRNIVAAESNYGIEFDAAIESGNVFATQFHPEKSGEIGLQILKNWASLA